MVGIEKCLQDIHKKEYHKEIELDRDTFKFFVYRKKKDPFGNEVKNAKIVKAGKTFRSTWWVPAVQK